MGLDLSFHLESQPAGLLRRRQSASAIVEGISDALLESVKRGVPELARLARRNEAEGGVEVALHPTAEPVRIHSEGAHRVNVTARTNVPGPGYHAFVVEALDAIRSEMKLELVSGEEGEPIDDTSFFERRDFAELQREHASWLRNVASIVVEKEEDVDLRISMPPDSLMPIDVKILAPMGPVSRAWFLEVAQLEPAALGPHASEFFGWWERGFGSEAAYGLARSLLQSCAWHPPEDEYERTALEVTRDLLRRPDVAGRSFDGDSAAELREEVMRLLQQTPESATAPRAEGFGVRRRLARVPLRDRADVVLPGYWYVTATEDGTTGVAWFGNITVRVSCYTPGSGTNALPDAHTAITHKSVARSRRWFDYEVKGGLATAVFDRDRDATDDCLLACAFVTVPDLTGLLTVAYDAEAQDEEVERILRSFRVTLPG